MDVLPRITGQIIELFRQMSSVQRVITAAVLATVLFAFGYLMVWNTSGNYQPVSTGKFFEPDELVNAEKAFHAVGLTDFRREGRRLLAPARELQKYNAALAETSNQPDDLGSQMLKQYETLGPFSTDKHRQQLKEALLLQELRQTIKAVPDVEDARVAIASSERRLAWNEKPRTTASVSIRLRRNRDMSPALVNSLRQVVANMVPDLKPSDVTVFDITRGQAYSGDPAREPQEARFQQRAREYARRYERQIEKALAHIPNISVNVNIDPESLKLETNRNTAERSAKEPPFDARHPESFDESSSHLTGFRGSQDEAMESSREDSFIAVLPQSIQVSISIPRDYLRNLIAHRAAKHEKSADRLNPELIEDEVLAKVEQIVSRLIPSEAASDSISVTFIDSIANNSGNSSQFLSNESLIHFARQWGAAIAVMLISLVLFVVYWQSTPSASRAVEHEAIDLPEVATESTIQEPSPIIQTQMVEVPLDHTAILREEIRLLAKADPAATAFVLNQWLTEVGS